MTAPNSPAGALAEALEWYADVANWKRKQGRWDMVSGPLPRIVGQESNVELDRGNLARSALRRLAQQPAPAPALAEENRKLRAAINQMAWRMDKRAEDYNRRNDGPRAACWKNAAGIVSQELACAALVNPDAARDCVHEPRLLLSEAMKP